MCSSAVVKVRFSSMTRSHLWKPGPTLVWSTGFHANRPYLVRGHLVANQNCPTLFAKSKSKCPCCTYVARPRRPLTCLLMESRPHSRREFLECTGKDCTQLCDLTIYILKRNETLNGFKCDMELVHQQTKQNQVVIRRVLFVFIYLVLFCGVGKS